MERGRIGAAAELAVSADLIRRGYNVFRAVAPSAPFDLVAEMDGLLTRVEVRSVPERADGSLGMNVKVTDECDLYAFICGNRIEYLTVEQVAERRRGPEISVPDCVVCHGPLQPGRRSRRYCSRRCQRIADKERAARSRGS